MSIAPLVAARTLAPSSPGSAASPTHLAPVAYVDDAAALAQTVHDLIAHARRSIVVQMYLFAANDELQLIQPVAGAFPYSHTVAGWLIEKKQSCPDVDVVVLLDTQTPDDAARSNKPGGPLTRHTLEAAGIWVLNANLFHTRFDSRRRFPPSARFHDPDIHGNTTSGFVAAQQRWQTIHNVEDHRKNIVIDDGAWAAVTSHNFIDVASHWHENLFLLGGSAARAVFDQVRKAVRDALDIPQRVDDEGRRRIERLIERGEESADGAVTRARELVGAVDEDPVEDHGWRRGPIVESLHALGDPAPRVAPALAPVEVLSSTTIRPRFFQAIAACQPGDEIRAASTYFSDLSLLEAFIDAARRGVRVRVLIDDCAALPLPWLASWAVRTLVNLRVVVRAAAVDVDGFELRVHASGDGRMMHMKTAGFSGPAPLVIGGQANFTPNSFTGAWLETDVVVADAEVLRRFTNRFDALYQAATPVGALSTGKQLKRRLLTPLLHLLALLGFRP